MNKPVKSTDPIKKTVMTALKFASKGRKVTNVKQVSEDRFEGDCFERKYGPKGSSGWSFIGRFWVEMLLSTDGSMGHMTNYG